MKLTHYLGNALYTGLVGLVLLGSTANAAPGEEVCRFTDTSRTVKKCVQDTGWDGLQERTIEYDDNGSETKISLDFGYDGKVDKIIFYKNDTKGRRISESTDFDGDGKIDKIETYDRDIRGKVIKYTLDRDADGKIDEIKTVEYDKEGNKTWVNEDFDANGTIDNRINCKKDRFSRCAI